MEEIKKQINDFRERLGILKEKLHITEKGQEIIKLEKEMSEPGFWDDQKEAQRKTKLLSLCKSQTNEIDDLELRLDSLEEIANTEEGSLLVEDINNEIRAIKKILVKTETGVYLGGKYDSSSAILSVHSGQGGTEAMDWADMLKRMYLRYAERKGWKVDILDLISGDEAGIKSVTMSINGDYAYGYLKGEKGAHRLVRQSPFNADKLRQTSFALVEVLPEIEEAADIPIPENDLEWDFFHASSHGGQNVQKVSTAVRLRHKPTDIVVTCQSERYQERNRELALALLRAKLWEIEEEKKLKETKDLKGEFKLAAWGNQIRSYVLHPYKMVKDLRTDYEENDPFAVLDGELDEFINEELKFFS